MKKVGEKCRLCIDLPFLCSSCLILDYRCITDLQLKSFPKVVMEKFVGSATGKRPCALSGGTKGFLPSFPFE